MRYFANFYGSTDGVNRDGRFFGRNEKFFLLNFLTNFSIYPSSWLFSTVFRKKKFLCGPKNIFPNESLVISKIKKLKILDQNLGW